MLAYFAGHACRKRVIPRGVYQEIQTASTWVQAGTGVRHAQHISVRLDSPARRQQKQWQLKCQGAASFTGSIACKSAKRSAALVAEGWNRPRARRRFGRRHPLSRSPAAQARQSIKPGRGTSTTSGRCCALSPATAHQVPTIGKIHRSRQAHRLARRARKR
jgi:hypothetical protein